VTSSSSSPQATGLAHNAARSRSPLFARLRTARHGVLRSPSPHRPRSPCVGRSGGGTVTGWKGTNRRKERRKDWHKHRQQPAGRNDPAALAPAPFGVGAMGCFLPKQHGPVSLANTILSHLGYTTLRSHILHSIRLVAIRHFRPFGTSGQTSCGAQRRTGRAPKAKPRCSGRTALREVTSSGIPSALSSRTCSRSVCTTFRLRILSLIPTIRLSRVAAASRHGSWSMHDTRGLLTHEFFCSFRNKLFVS
jgi:hypothetical protein